MVLHLLWEPERTCFLGLGIKERPLNLYERQLQSMLTTSLLEPDSFRDRHGEQIIWASNGGVAAKMPLLGVARAVLFTVAVLHGFGSEFDQVLFEDESTNRLTEAIALFDQICNSQWFLLDGVGFLYQCQRLCLHGIGFLCRRQWRCLHGGRSCSFCQRE